MKRLGVAGAIVFFYLLSFVSYGAYQIYWSNNTPQTLAGAVPCTIISNTTNATCPDASAAVNTAIFNAARLGIPLYIDQPYGVANPVILLSNTTIYAAPGACFVQQFSPHGNLVGVVGNGNYQNSISNVTAYDLQICGDPMHVLCGSGYRLYVINSVFYNPTDNHVGCGRAFTVIAANSWFYNPSFYDPIPVTGNGAFRIEGCRDSQVIGGYGVSGDGTWQFSPPPDGQVPNQSIVRCRFEHVGGESLDGGFFSAQLHVEGPQEYMLGNVWPPQSSGICCGYSIGQTLTCQGGSPACQITITQANAGYATQAVVVNPGTYTGEGGSTTVTMTDGSTWNASWPNAYQGSGCIIDSGISGAPGQAISGRGITIGNEGSNGGQCPGRAPIDGLTVSDLTLDDSQDQQSAQVISVSGSDSAHPVGSVTFNNVSVPNPFSVCVNVTGPVRHVVFNHLVCGKSHQGLVGTLAATAVWNANTLQVSAATCRVIRSGDTIAVVLDDNAAANGGYAGKQQIFTPLAGDCVSGNVTLPSRLLGLASVGLAQVYDYAEQVYTLVAATPPGSYNVQLQLGSLVSPGNGVILVCDDGTANSATVQSVNTGDKTEIVTLNAACTAGASAGNLFVNRAYNSQHPVVFLESVRGAVFNQPVLYGADAPVILLGSTSGSPVPSSDVAMDDARLFDVAPGTPGAQYQNCDFCVMKGGSVAAAAGSGTSNLAQFSKCQPNPLPPPACGSPYTDYLATAMGAVGTTVATENFSLFNYAHPFYAQIDSEIVLVRSGMGSPNWIVARGQLGTTGTSHSVGAAITIAQTGATDSPISNVDIGDLGVSDLANAISNHIPGQGNDIEALQGVDWEATQVKVPTSGTLDYLDDSPQVDLAPNGGATTIISLGYKQTVPFRAKCQRWYNTTNGNITVFNGTTIHNTGGSNYTLTSHGYGEWCFDPNLQALYQLRGSAN